jgi:hypothetical protein
MPLGKAVVRTVTAWGEKSTLGERDPAGKVKSVRMVWGTEKPVRLVPELVRPVWRQQGGQSSFRARDESRLVSGGCGFGGWSR